MLSALIAVCHSRIQHPTLHLSPTPQEGWAPTTFISSRASRAERTQRTAADFMDKDELDELGADTLAAKADYDTFGAAAADAQMEEAERADTRKPSALSATALAVVVVPVADGVGTRLLRKMGWRHGRGVSRLRPDGTETTGRRRKRRERAEEGPVIASVDPELLNLVVRARALFPDKPCSSDSPSSCASRDRCCVSAAKTAVIRRSPIVLSVLPQGLEGAVLVDSAALAAAGAGNDADDDEDDGEEEMDKEEQLRAERRRRKRRRWGAVAGALQENVEASSFPHVSLFPFSPPPVA